MLLCCRVAVLLWVLLLSFTFTHWKVLHGADLFVDKDGRAYVFVITHTLQITEDTYGEYVLILEFKDNKLYVLAMLLLLWCGLLLLLLLPSETSIGTF